MAFDWEIPTEFPPIRIRADDGKQVETSIHVIYSLALAYFRDCKGDWDAFAPVVRKTLEWEGMQLHQWQVILAKLYAWQEEEKNSRNFQMVRQAEDLLARLDRQDSSSDSSKSPVGTSPAVA